MLVTKLSSQFDYGHLRGWKCKIYVTTVLDSFQDRKGINLKMINSYQVIGLYGMKYRSKKKNWAQGGDTPAPLACLSRAPLSFLSPNDIHVPSPKATKMSLFCSSFSLCHGTDFSAPFWLSFTGVILVSGNESKVSSTGCTKNQWLQCSCRLMGSLQKYFYSRLLQTWFLLLLCKYCLFGKY